LYVASNGNGVLVRPLSEVAAVAESRTLARSWALHQNYPNPFNPGTTITYQLSAIHHASLKVYDVLGREVATLVNEVQQPGVHTVTWVASNQSSGIYFYRLVAGPFAQTKKSILMK
jgi:hypothetical protein